MISGPGAEWLERRREELNQRFLAARRKYPALAPAAVLDLLSRAMNAIAGPNPSDGLLSAIYDLVLLHAGRDALAIHPGLPALLFDTFPRIRPLLERRPGALVPALSNAVENLGPRGDVFAHEVAGLATDLEDPDVLLDACGVLAWRLGEPRLRAAALRVAATLPPRTLLRALGLGDWPEAAALVTLAALETDAWQLPADRIAPATLDALARAPDQRLAAIVGTIRASSPVPLGSWRVAGSVGAFTGFGGAFDSPPVVLDGGDRHTLHVRAGDAFFLVEADGFGWRCRPEPDPQLPVRRPEAKGAMSRLAGKLGLAGGEPRLAPDGTLEAGGESARLPHLKASASFAWAPGRIAVTHADSHHVRVLVPWRDPV